METPALVDRVGKWVALVVAGLGFIWGVVGTVQSNALAARKPFLNLQLELYREATSVTATLAASNDPAKRAKAEQRFWQLYYGELALVENGGFVAPENGVEGAMVRFGKRLRQRPRPEDLQQLSLDLAYACRDSLAVSWGTEDWTSPRARQSS